MQPKNTYMNVRVERGLLEEVTHIFDELGMTRSEAINVIFTQIKLHRGLPFPVKIPNAETVEAIEDIVNQRNLTRMTLESMVQEFYEEDEVNTNPQK